MALTVGDIAIIGVNTDNPDEMAFVALASIPANTTITFTDCGWTNATATFRNSEHAWAWRHTAEVAAGTVVRLQYNTDWAVASGPGTAYTAAWPITNVGFSTSGDSILAYQGNGWNDRPTSNGDAKWLFGFSTLAWTTTGAPNSNQSDCPTALFDNSAAVNLTETATDVDNGYFASGTVAQTSVSIVGNKSFLLGRFKDGVNMYYENSTGPLTFPTYTITVVPEPALLGVAAVALLAFRRCR
jgi:hypothetical protein